MGEDRLHRAVGTPPDPAPRRGVAKVDAARGDEPRVVLRGRRGTARDPAGVPVWGGRVPAWDVSFGKTAHCSFLPTIRRWMRKIAMIIAMSTIAIAEA